MLQLPQAPLQLAVGSAVPAGGSSRVTNDIHDDALLSPTAGLLDELEQLGAMSPTALLNSPRPEVRVRGQSQSHLRRQMFCTSTSYSVHGGLSQTADAFELKLQFPLYGPDVITKQPGGVGLALAPVGLKPRMVHASWQYCSGTSKMPCFRHDVSGLSKINALAGGGGVIGFGV